MSQKKIKIAIQSSYGAFRLSKDMYKELQGLSVPRARMKLAEFLEENSVEIKDPRELAEAKGYFFIERDVERGSKRYYYYSPEDDDLFCSFRIVEVDTSSPWRLTEYDGAESIEYLNFKAEEFNYCPNT